MPDDFTPVLAAACAPWAFTQESPLRTEKFCKEAARRGIQIKEIHLRELWRIGALAPLVEVRNDKASQPVPSPIPEPRVAGTSGYDLRAARDSGRLVDPTVKGFRHQLRFTSSAAGQFSRGWWNGLLYSRWQLIQLHEVRDVLAGGEWVRQKGKRVWRAPSHWDGQAQFREEARRRTVAVVALEAAYLPRVQKGRIQLTNTTVEEWRAFRDQFDPIETLRAIGWQPDELPTQAERLLNGVRSLDPLGGDWSELVRRAPPRAWENLQGDALAAMDRRIAAEILLLCHQDLAEQGLVSPLEPPDGMFYRPLHHERTSYRRTSLDGNLAALGLSPHPGVVLVVEGETEELLVSRVRDHLDLPIEDHAIRSIVLRGVGHDFSKLAVLACAPLIERRETEHWLIAKPPTYLLVAVDPDPPFDTPEQVEAERQKIVDEIVWVVRAQGVDPERSEIESLIEIAAWEASCFEFEHFTDEDLADALRRVHPDCNGLDRASLTHALSKQRAARQDIKNVWKNWATKPSKKDLAAALWPSLQAQLDRAKIDETAAVPTIAERLIEAYFRAGGRATGRFVLTGQPWPRRDDDDPQE